MKAWQAWLEAAKLFWQRPVLSLPVLTAAIFPFVIDAVNHWFMRWLLPPPIEAYGAGSPLSQTLLQPVKAYWPLLLGGFFVYATLYVAALFVTAGAVRRLRSEEPTGLLRYGAVFARSRWRGVMWLSLVGLVFVVLETVIREGVFGLSVSVFRDWMVDNLQLWRMAMAGLLTVLHGGEAWILAGIALRYVASADSRAMTNGEVQQGRRLAIATVLAATALGQAMTFVQWIVIPEGGLDGTVASWELGTIHTVITAFPYVLLFIGMALLMERDAGEIAPLPRIDVRTDRIGGTKTGLPKA